MMLAVHDARGGPAGMAGYKDLVVYVDDAPSCAARLQAAVDLARTGGAHLTRLAVAELTMIPEFVPANVMEQLHSDAAARNERLRERFETALRGETVSSEWRATDQLAAGGTVLDVLALHARYADLAVVGQVDPDATRSLVPADLAAELALVSGRPVLAIPYAWEPRPIGRRVLVGWNAGREAARAVGDALPFLEAAEAVRVAAFTRPGRSGGHGDMPGADIAAHLS
jgi:nucleotide-binding universal stress UspA family protein